MTPCQYEDSISRLSLRWAACPATSTVPAANWREPPLSWANPKHWLRGGHPRSELRADSHDAHSQGCYPGVAICCWSPSNRSLVAASQPPGSAPLVLSATCCQSDRDAGDPCTKSVGLVAAISMFCLSHCISLLPICRFIYEVVSIESCLLISYQRRTVSVSCEPDG